MKFCTLASGSAGNCILVESDGTYLLVDAGLACAEIVRRLAEVGVAPDDISGIVVTHEHTDHVRGVHVLSRRFRIPVYANSGTFRATPALEKAGRLVFFETGNPFTIGGLAVTPFSLSHDAADPVGFVISDGRKTLGIAADLGVATRLVVERLRGADALVVESNHDPEMLERGPYPWPLKQRIAGRLGHLSNEDCGALVQELLHPGLRHVVLAHLSETNNAPELALRCVQSCMEDMDGQTTLHAARQDRPGPVFKL